MLIIKILTLNITIAHAKSHSTLIFAACYVPRWQNASPALLLSYEFLSRGFAISKK